MCQARFIVRALINSHLDIFPFLLYLALGNKIRLKKKKKKKKPEKVESYIYRFRLPFLLRQHLKVERRLYLPSIKYNNEAIQIFRDKCPLSILASYPVLVRDIF